MTTDPARAGGLCLILPPDDARCLHLMGLVDTRAKLRQNPPPPPPPRPSPGIPRGTQTSAFSLNSCSSSSLGFLLRTSMRGALGAAPGGREGLAGGRRMDGWNKVGRGGTGWDGAVQPPPVPPVHFDISKPNRTKPRGPKAAPSLRQCLLSPVPLGLRPPPSSSPVAAAVGADRGGHTRGTWGSLYRGGERDGAGWRGTRTFGCCGSASRLSPFPSFPGQFGVRHPPG